ncbi:HNH endonuclease [Streptomyces sp. NPDC048208]|uniref:HNH endonuclease n=1 Tax=Streptomyces sp. NPDC048208 TaxID=3365515 RepID=UPI003715C44C
MFPELDRAKKIAWRTNNPDRYRAGKYAQKKRERARKLNAETDGWTRADVLRVAVESDAYGCIWCHGDPGDDWQADHIYPLSRGGSDRLENIGVACQPCNSSKSNKLPFEEWTP